jgi:flagellar basal-body rod modification protein FlgD
MSYIDVTGTLADLSTNTAKVNAEKNAATKGSADIGQDAFLQLLMAQLKNQDPMNPTDSKEFMSQQAQFTQISELQKLNKNVAAGNSMMQASALIGKEVTLTNPDNVNDKLKGVVTEATMDSAGANVVINGKPYPISYVTNIKEPSQTNS